MSNSPNRGACVACAARLSRLSRARRSAALLAALAPSAAALHAAADPGVPINGLPPPVAATLGPAFDRLPNFAYDPATGDVTINWNQDLALLHAPHYLSLLSVQSASGLLLSANAAPGVKGASPVVLTGTQVSAVNVITPGFPRGFDLGPILPPNLSAGALAVDLTLRYGTDSFSSAATSPADLVYPGVTSLPINTFIGPAGNWSAPANWSLGHVPQAGDAVVLSAASGAGAISFDRGVMALPVLSSLTIDATGGASVQFEQAQGTLYVNGNEVVGATATGQGAVAQTGGLHSVAGSLTLGRSAGAIGTYTMSGGNLTVFGGLVAGGSGFGQFNHAGGGTVAVTGGLVLGRAAGSGGIYNLRDGATLIADSEAIGNLGAAVFNQTGGTHVVGSSNSGGLSIAISKGSIGTLNLSGGTLIATAESVGGAGSGGLQQTGGANLISGGLSVGSPGVVNLTGGTLSTKSLTLAGIFNYSGGSLTTGPQGTSTSPAIVVRGQLNITAGGTRILNGNVSNNGTITASRNIVQFNGSFTNTGTYQSQQADTYFNGNLTLGENGRFIGGPGDRFFILGNITEPGDAARFNAAGAEFHVSGGGAHQFSTYSKANPIPQLIVDPGNTLNLRGGTAATVLLFGDITSVLPISAPAANTVISNLIGTGNVTLGAATARVGTSLTVGSMAVNAVTLNNGGALVLGQGTQSTSSDVNSLAINTGGKLDINRSTLVLNYGAAPDPQPQIRQWLASGHGPTGTWNGTGITSSFAAITSNRARLGIGYTDGRDGFIPGLLPGHLLLRPTLYGDVNFDGAVTAADINQIIARGHLNDGTSNNGWIDGDLNYDGIVNTADFRIIALSGNYSGTLPAAAAASTTAASAAPRPAYRYDPATGDLILAATGNAGIVDLHLLSAGDNFLPASSTFGTFSTRTPGELEGVLLGSSFGDGYDLGHILPAGLSLAAVQADLTAFYGISGGGVEVPAAVVVPELASTGSIAAGFLCGVLGRRRRRRRIGQ